MPGHKGRVAFDITELPGTDNLYDPQGCIALSQKLFPCQEKQGILICLRINGPFAGKNITIQYLVSGMNDCILTEL